MVYVSLGIVSSGGVSKIPPCCCEESVQTKARWTCPPSGYIKINVDDTFHQAEKKGGIGAVVRNEVGVCLAAFARSLPFISSAWHVKAEVCRVGLLITIH